MTHPPSASDSGAAPPSQHSVPPAYPENHPPPAVPGPRRNRFAVAALATSVLIPLLGLVFAIVALVQIKRRPQDGRGLAIGALWVVGAEILIVMFILFGGTENPFGRQGRDRTPLVVHDIDSFEIGDCVNDLKEGDVSSFPVHTCDEPHDGEVVAKVNLTGIMSNYPGD